MTDDWQDIGDMVVAQLEQAIANSKSHEHLRKTFPGVRTLVEQMCPVAVQLGPDGMQIAYGPYLQGYTGPLVIVANSAGNAIAGLIQGDGLPDMKDTAPCPARAYAWAKLFDYIREDDFKQLSSCSWV